jgi:hypothetical protein
MDIIILYCSILVNLLAKPDHFQFDRPLMNTFFATLLAIFANLLATVDSGRLVTVSGYSQLAFKIQISI